MLIALVCSIGTCSHATGPTEPSATVTVPQQGVTVETVAAGEVTWIEFTLPLKIHNSGSGPLTFAYCASAVETRTNDAWIDVWTPICALGSSTSLVIPAGEQRELAVTISAAIQGPGGPPWRTEGVGGVYRFVAGLIAPGTDGRIPTVASNAFTLTAGAARR